LIQLANISIHNPTDHHGLHQTCKTMPSHTYGPEPLMTFETSQDRTTLQPDAPINKFATASPALHKVSRKSSHPPPTAVPRGKSIIFSPQRTAPNAPLTAQPHLPPTTSLDTRSSGRRGPNCMQPLPSNLSGQYLAPIGPIPKQLDPQVALQLSIPVCLLCFALRCLCDAYFQC